MEWLAVCLRTVYEKKKKPHRRPSAPKAQLRTVSFSCFRACAEDRTRRLQKRMTALYLHEDVKELLAGKTLVVLGDSVERSVYKDLVCLLQENRYLTDGELRKKGEESFIGDELVYGGVKGELKNSINYRECRYYKADNEACCRYYFVTICYGDYVEEILQELSLEPTDIIVMNSCLWDVHRHGKKGIEKYEENLEKLVASLRRLLPDCLFIWLTTPPVHIKSKGGFLIRPGVDTVKIQEVKYCNEIAREVFTAANEIDRRFRIVDLDYVFQYFAHHRAGDGVHWNERAHRRMSNMILEEISKAFNKSVPRILGSDEFMWNGSRTEHNAYYEPPPPYSQWDDPERLGWDYEQRFHDNGWDFDKMRRPLPPPRGYPFGPPPPPGPFGPPSLIPRPFMEDPRSIMPNMFDDLDDLGHARLQVESQIENRKRKRTEEDDNDDEKLPEKQYRFGVAPSAVKRKAEPIENETKKIKIIEEEGVMKKVVTLEDSVIYSPMSEKEKTAYLKAQAEKAEKERLAKERKEKEEKQRAERLERERLQKLKKEEEESAAAADEEKKRTESTADEKPAISPKEKAETKYPKLEEVLPSVSKLPLVSSVPKSTEEQTEKETKNEKKQGGLSKFASKLLSFIRRPSCEKTNSDNVNQSKSVRRLSSQEDKVISPTKTTPLRRRVYEVIPLGELAAKVLLQNESNSKSNQSTHEQLNKLTKTNRQVECDRTSHVEEGDAGNISTSSVSIVFSTTVPTGSTTVFTTTTTTTPAIPKKVDTLALLSLQSPFAKTKSNAALVDTDKNTNAEKSSVDKQNSKTEEQLEQELLHDSKLHETDVINSTLENQSSKDGTNNTLTINKIDQKEGPSASSEKEPRTETVKTTSESTESSDKKIQKCQGEGSVKKKKKKDKHADETKEERQVRKQKKREKKKLKEENKQRKLLAAQNAEAYQQNINWNVPLRQHNVNSLPRQRSATWTPSYFHAYQNSGHNTQQPTVQRQQQPTPQQQVPDATPQVILNPYQQILQTQLLQQQQQQQQQQQIMQQRQQILAQQQQQQQQLVQQQALLQQQKTQATQQTIKKPTSQTQQLYIDEYGQTYTLEEETYIVGPSGQIQNISSGSSYIQQQQQQGTQYLQSSLLYPQQRFL
ncbi:calponin homology domain-containing protein DDB_G0272472-like [Hydractinia symbiolongicarpus]|uniref:calponin homology domain-containing protein DDB_G0272472-like n=1 Tax=Hydractinia symbiolongicarpus TaxID=13093 RepID=UPI00254A57CD|nr:calponin homology domain-containing protein DDB_G0272472-like [Hydractinia symbiolongicarpus]